MGENLSTEIKTRANENFEIKNEQLKLKESLMPMPLLQKRFQFFNVALVTLIITVVGSVIAYIITQFLK